MGKEQLLSMYTDLTLARYEVLKEAEAGTLKKMNGAMHEAISHMVDSKFQINDFGRYVLSRANEIMEGDGELHSPLSEDVINRLRAGVTSSFAARMRKRYPHNSSQISSVHVKLLISLSIYPLQSYRSLLRAYGFDNIAILYQLELIKGIGREYFPSGTTWSNGWKYGVPWNLTDPERITRVLLSYL